MSGTEILEPLDAAQLMSQGLAGPPDSTGTRKIHKRRLNRLSEAEYGHLPLTPLSQSEAASPLFVSIPDQLVSRATIEYLGFTKTKATEIWDAWDNWPSTGPQREADPDSGGLVVTFLDFVSGYIAPSFDTSDDDDEKWTACMNRYGLTTEFQGAINP